MAYGLVGIVATIAAWQLVAAVGGIGPTLPTPGAAAVALVGVLGTGSFWADVLVTVVIALIGLIAGIIIGAVLGILIGSSEALTRATRGVLEFLKPIPPIVILPLAVLIWGPTVSMAIFLIFYTCMLTIIYQAINGVRETDPVALETARSYGLRKPEILIRIVVPSASAFIGTAIRVTMPSALVVAVVAGLLGGGPGLGLDIFQANSASDYAAVYAYVIVLGVLGVLFQAASASVEKRVLHWHPSYQEVAH